MVETTDLIFAVDSIPAIFAITQEPFIAYSSNVFAILGLRALYFLLADVIHRFHHLKIGLSMVLVFVGLKMLATDVYKVPISVSLSVIVLVLCAAIAASWFWPRTPPAEEEPIYSAGADSANRSSGADLAREDSGVPFDEKAGFFKRSKR